MAETSEDETFVRPAIVRFAIAMEMALRQNEQKGGWEGLANDFLLRRLHHNVDELDSLAGYTCPHCGAKRAVRPDLDAMLKSAADIGNYAMMMYDNTNRKKEEPK